MFSWRRKLGEPLKSKPSSEEGDATGREEHDEGAPKAEDALITQTVSLEELEDVAGDLAEAQEKSPEEDDDVLTQSIKVEEEPAAEEKDVNVLPGSADDKESEGEGDSFSNLFSQDEEEENPLAGLIASVPDVTAREVLDEAQEVEEMLRRWQQSQEGHKSA